MDQLYTNLSDDQLLMLLQHRDEVAFAEVYRRHFSMLYMHAYKMLDDKGLAQDVVQDLFVAFWQKSANLEVRTNLKAYLYVAARNRVLTMIKKQKSNRDFISMVAKVMVEEDNTTMEQISERELLVLIDREIDKLPPRMKQVFELSRKSFMSNKEIAELLGTSEETVKKQVHKSLAILKTKLGGYAGLAVVLLAAVDTHRVN
jgi:RNA polymerase sigma-70 factor (ECF subfamily)